MSAHSLLYQHASVRFPAAERFVAADLIRVGNTIGEHVIRYVNPNLQKLIKGIVEEDVSAAPVKCWSLVRKSTSLPIIQALAGKERAATPLVRAIQAIELGPTGPGLFNGYFNISFSLVPRQPTLCWAVGWAISGGGLHFSAFADNDANVVWEDRVRVFGG